jgi:AraC-like DNA-binding protein
MARAIKSRRAPAYRYAVEALVGKLVVDLCRTFSDLPPEIERFELPESAADLQVRTITRYLEDNYRRPITVRDVAAQLHLSDRHARRLFRNVMGISLIGYLTRQRLQIAAHILLTGNVPIKEVAAHCGYPDVQYFTGLFRRTMGLPPGRFREQRGTLTLGDKPGGAARVNE